MHWLLRGLEFVIGCGLLAWGADRFIASSIVVARRFNMPSLFIGMLLVGFGTSFPEMVVAIIASLHGKPAIAIGNAIGSNITNIGLVLGVTVLLVPLTVQSRIVKREFPLVLLVSLITGAVLWNGALSRIDGFILLAVLAIVLYFIFFIGRNPKEQKDDVVQEVGAEISQVKMTFPKAVLWWFIGLALLFISSELIIDSAVAIASDLGVSDLVIGLTIVALGTSLPELAATLTSAFRNEPDIAIGNVIGSNIFNLLAVMAMPALISPTGFSSKVIMRDYPVMLALTIILWLFALLPPNKGRLSRVAGGVLILSYASYIYFLISNS